MPKTGNYMDVSSFKTGREMKTFSDKQMLRKFITARFTFK
jgi:hypothetical protein